MANNVTPLKHEHKGLLMIIGGVLILLYAFNFFARWLNALVIIIAVLMIFAGIMKLGGAEKIKRFLKKK